MPYVSVPVPEEHVEEVMQFILRSMARASVQALGSSRASASSWERGRLELSRSLLSVRGHGPPWAEKDLAELDVATMMQLQRAGDDRHHAQTELNEQARQTDPPKPDVPANRLQSAYRTAATMEKRVLFMEDDIAALLRQVEETDRTLRADPTGWFSLMEAGSPASLGGRGSR